MQLTRYKIWVGIFLLPALFLSRQARAQYTKADSLKVFSFINRAEFFFNESRYDSALFYCDKAVLLSRETGFKKGLAYAQIEAGDIYIDKDDLDKANEMADNTSKLGLQIKDSLVTAIGILQSAQVKMYSDKYDEAIVLYDKCLNYYLAKHPTKYSALAYNDLGYTWGRKGDLNKNAENLIRSVSIYENNFPAEAANIAVALNNLAGVYNNLDQKYKAIEYAKKSIVYREKAGDVAALALGYCNISQFYAGIDKQESEKYMKLCVKYSVQSGQDNRIIHSYLAAALFYYLQNPEMALEYEMKAIAILEKTRNDRVMLARSYMDAGMLCGTLKKDTSVIIGFYNKALELVKQSADKASLRDFYGRLSNYYRDNGKYEEAFLNYKKYILYRDSIISEKTKSDIADIFTKYETKKKDDEIAKLSIDQKIRQLEIEKQKAVIAGNLLEAKQKQNEITLLSQQGELQDAKLKEQGKELERQSLLAQNNKQQLQLSQQEKLLKENELKQQKQFRNILVGSALGLLLFAGFMFNRYQLKKKLDRQKELLEIRNNIARDLHDEIGSTLTGIKILSEISQHNLHKDQDKAAVMIAKITEQSEQMQQGMSDIVWAIKPDNDKLENMLVRMREYAAAALEPRNIQVAFEVDEELLLKSLNMQQRKDVFLVFKEAVNNAAKYAEATLVQVKLFRQGGLILLQVADNGKGFEMKGATSSNGLKNIQARAASLGGNARIHSEKNIGTTVTVEVPAT